MVHAAPSVDCVTTRAEIGAQYASGSPSTRATIREIVAATAVRAECSKDSQPVRRHIELSLCFIPAPQGARYASPEWRFRAFARAPTARKCLLHRPRSLAPNSMRGSHSVDDFLPSGPGLAIDPT